MTSYDELGDRMKTYEKFPRGERLMPLLPVIARLDGKAFHTFTKGLDRPYDEGLAKLMAETTRFLVEETGALLGYTQSDEITLIFYSSDRRSQIFMDGKTDKMVSLLAAMATAKFNQKLPEHLPAKRDRTALFDCRVFNVPTKIEATNNILWRVIDAQRNSVMMAARSVFSDSQVHGKDPGQLQEMLFQKGINWNDYPRWAKEGTYVRRRTVSKPFTPQDLEKLPPNHNYWKNPGLMVDRIVVETMGEDMPSYRKIKNRVEFIFNGADPEIKTESAPNGYYACTYFDEDGSLYVGIASKTFFDANGHLEDRYIIEDVKPYVSMFLRAEVTRSVFEPNASFRNSSQKDLDEILTARGFDLTNEKFNKLVRRKSGRRYVR